MTFFCKTNIDILTSANCLLIQNVPIITHMHKRRNSIRENISRHISANKTYDNNCEDDVLMLNEFSNATAVATVAAPAVTPDAALI